ncbi:unnamed protein product [Protopolystoma xenopodis]|uniref:Uncharacterized protein n=1 Tax=Protopolystoma xenopodis TaxID=117903 RepID=A0A448X972_9PLAT|nr:unnamed protein product [Protopolystoma xenopodis]
MLASQPNVTLQPLPPCSSSPSDFFSPTPSSLPTSCQSMPLNLVGPEAEFLNGDSVTTLAGPIADPIRHKFSL